MIDSSKTAPAVSVFDFDTMKHPYQAYRTLRDSDPVHFEPLLNVNVVTRYDLVREAIKDTGRFSSRCTFPLGHFNSSSLTLRLGPTPKCSRLSFEER